MSSKDGSDTFHNSGRNYSIEAEQLWLWNGLQIIVMG